MGVLMKQGVNYSGGTVKVQPVIYSTDEREIGVWTDGKPLYQKTIIYDNQTTIGDGYTSIALLSNIDHIDIVSGGIVNSNGDSYYSLPYVFGNKSTSWYYDAGDLGIRVANDTWSSDWDIIITIQYTKTTDTAGSGLWSTTGAPNRHYSLIEQVIGTWVDGSPLYEKTFYVPTLSTGNNVQTHGITNFDKLISAEGFFYRNGTVQVKVPTSSPSAATYNTDITDITSTTFNIEVGNSWGSYTLTNAYITIRYTKISS